MRYIIFILFVIAFETTAVLAQAPQVISVMPSQNELNVLPSTDISVTFDMDMDAMTINEHTFNVRSLYRGFHPGQYIYNEESRTATLHLIQDYFAGDVITIVLTARIQSRQGIPMERSYAWSFTVIVSNGLASFTLDSDPAVGDTPTDIIAADLDGDGDLDIANANWTSNDVTVLKNDGDGEFSLDGAYEIGVNANSLRGGDLDKDGDIDLVTTNWSTQNISVLFNDGEGAFPDVVNYPIGDGSSSVAVADVDGDADLDLSVIQLNLDNVKIFFNNGNGEFNNSAIFPVAAEPRMICSGDFDRDGDIDLSATAFAADKVSVLYNNGYGDFSDRSDFSTSLGPLCIAASDLDGDGHLDIVLTNHHSSTVGVLLNHGDGSFAPEISFGVNPDPVTIFTGDLDMDGDLDITTSHYNHAYTSLLINDGTGSFSEGNDFFGGRCHNGGDLDGDGDLDFASTLPYSDEVYILLNENNTDITLPEVPSPVMLYLGQNYPNPFNAVTKISFSLPRSGPTSLKIYNIAGRVVRTLIDDVLDAGRQRIIWDGTGNNNEAVASGIYLYAIDYDDRKITRKMLLLK